jgi:hypothetical protein
VISLDRLNRALSRQRAACIFAAILLVLHWAAPSFRPFDPLPPPAGSQPAYSSADLGVCRGTLPRLLSRVNPFEAGLPKSGQSDRAAGDKFKALSHVVHVIEPCGEAATAGYPAIARYRAAPAHSFEARAPPKA